MAITASLVAPAIGADDEVLNSYGLADEESVITSSRFPRPASRIAENVTVVTADDIERLNAHTLAELLQTIPGIQLDQVRTPGSWGFFSISGALSRHILVQIDGVPQNFLSADNTAEVGLIPVQHIERVEIVKGAASTSWGSALGGVINVITKLPASDRAIAGTVSASAGERHTFDHRGELNGTVNRIGYYLGGGNINSKGLVPGNRINFNHAFGKLTYDLPASGKITLGLDFRDSSRGLEDYEPFDFHDTNGFRNASSYLSFSQPLADRLTLDVNGYLGRRQLKTRWGSLASSDLFKDTTTREDSRGASVSLNWGGAEANLAAGVEYDHNDTRLRDPIIQVPELNFDSRLDRFGAYLNGSYTIGPLTVLPGLRYDHADLLEDALSYGLGATLRLSDTTLFRVYGARGYSMPVVSNPAIVNGRKELQNINTIQAGIETTAIPYLWLKGTLFYNNIWKIQQWDSSTVPATVTLREQVRQGFELEARTSPLLGFAVSGGYTYIDAWDKHSKAQLTGLDGAPPIGAKVALNYDNSSIGLRGAVTGNYVWWRLPADNNPRDKSMIWDLHLTQKLLPANELSPEIFFSARNLFNGFQQQDQIFANTPRWVEAGVRFRF